MLDLYIRSYYLPSWDGVLGVEWHTRMLLVEREERSYLRERVYSVIISKFGRSKLVYLIILLIIIVALKIVL